jgi:hypothetical protein
MIVANRKNTVASVLAASLALAPAAANAACTQADLTGRWQVYMVAASAAGQSWAQCALNINAGGVIAKTDCTDSSSANAALVNGVARMTIPAACTFTAHFTLAGRVFTVVHATMAQDKVSGTGVGTRPGEAFLFTMTKVATGEQDAATHANEALTRAGEALTGRKN